jgi:hypothetical protein
LGVFASGLDEAYEKGMSPAWGRGEFRMELAGQKPGVSRNFDGLDQFAIERGSAKFQPGRFQACLVMIVEFIPVAMTFRDDVLPVYTACQTIRGQFALLATQTHGAADL